MQTAIERVESAQRGVDSLESLVARRLQYIRLAQEFAEIANRSDSVEDAIADALECFCSRLNWQIGHAYLLRDPASKQFFDAGIWWIADDLNAQSFIESSERLNIVIGRGFVGDVIASKEARWIGDGIADALIGRSEAAKSLQLSCGLALPILVQSRVAGVLEFFSRDPQACEPEVLDAVAQLGTQLGRIVERVELERDLARVMQEEKRHLGQELHDTLSQQLTGIGMLARSLERKLEDDGHSEHSRATTLVESIQEAREQLRAIARGLNPINVTAESVGRDVADYANATSKTFDIRCEIANVESLTVDDDFTANELFCILREAIHNAAKHSQASLIAIEVIEKRKGRLKVCVRDNGRGFDVPSLERTGMGLRTLRYRGRLIGARIRIESHLGSGTSVICTLKPGEES